MTRSRTSLRDSHPGSPDSDEDSSDTKNPRDGETPSRGRRGLGSDEQAAEIMDTRI